MITYEDLLNPAARPELASLAIASECDTGGADLDDAPPVLPIPELIQNKRASGDVDRFKAQVLALNEADSRTLIVRIATTTDPLLLWAIHLTLSSRGIPPSQRWPGNVSTEQHKFVSWLADIYWFHTHNPNHVPKYRSWQRFMLYDPGSNTWHKLARFAYDPLRHTLSYGSALALALTPAQRLDSITLATDATNRDRQSLHPKAFETVRQALSLHAYGHCDPSGRRNPEESANRRAAIWRAYLLTGRNKAETVRVWCLLSGEQLSRQAMSVLVKKIAVVLNDKGKK